MKRRLKKRVTIIVAFHFIKLRLKTLTKSHDYSQLFSEKAPTKNQTALPGFPKPKDLRMRNSDLNSEKNVGAPTSLSE